MSATNETVIDHETLRALQDRTDIEEVLYKYSSAVDSFDKEGVRSCLADDIHAQYGNGEAGHRRRHAGELDRRRDGDLHLAAPPAQRLPRRRSTATRRARCPT